MPREPAFEVELTGATEPGKRLLVGLAGQGVAGLTAADYLVNTVETEQIGHLKTRHLPDITPFSNGQPRHPIRLYRTVDSDVTVLISEVLLPIGVADLFTDALTGWTASHSIQELTVLYGVPFPHSEQEHVVFHVSTDEYRARHFPDDDGEIKPLPGGFFDGVIGELMVRSLDGEAPPMGVLVTPTHLPGPDLDAALRLLDALEPVCGISIDEGELQDRATEMERYYKELADRMQELQTTGQGPEGGEYTTDRMYM